MGAYAYCSCGAPHDAPTAREVVEGRTCYACGKNVPVYDSLADVIERLESRVEDLETEVKQLKGDDDHGA